ncbi:hypothetical protein [Shinella sp.]|uniref:hypothetical protein n=1 Tax=Shinella sp. TaxID=1870904 RepID=UPI0028A65A46|nr:hypothetical protein [Shinella sp.]
MSSQFMVRILRDTDEDYADVVVNADDETSAKEVALNLVRANPDQWFDCPPQPEYIIDPSSEVEDVSDCGYASANEVTL